MNYLRILREKRAQGISINLIIIAAIGLVVLIIVFIMVSRRTGIFSKGVESEEKFVLSCLCRAPGTDRACASTQPSGFSKIQAMPLACNTWIDCTSNCYSK